MQSSAPNCLMKAWQDHETELRRWMRHRLPSEADADDMLQDLFLRALRQRERFCSILNARAWLFTVARNAIADRLRLKRHAFVPSRSDGTCAAHGFVRRILGFAAVWSTMAV